MLTRFEFPVQERNDATTAEIVELQFDPSLFRKTEAQVHGRIEGVGPGGEMEADSMLLEHTLMLGGDIAASGTVWQGWPGDLVATQLQPTRAKLQQRIASSPDYLRRGQRSHTLQVPRRKLTGKAGTGWGVIRRGERREGAREGGR